MKNNPKQPTSDLEDEVIALRRRFAKNGMLESGNYLSSLRDLLLQNLVEQLEGKYETIKNSAISDEAENKSKSQLKSNILDLAEIIKNEHQRIINHEIDNSRVFKEVGKKESVLKELNYHGKADEALEYLTSMICADYNRYLNHTTKRKLEEDQSAKTLRIAKNANTIAIINLIVTGVLSSIALIVSIFY